MPRSRLPREFSGGQRQRIAIARALALDPKLIVCDEPVSALDLSTQARVLDLFIEIQERTGVAYLFITHDLAVVRHISHRVAVMYRGELVEKGDGDQVTSRPVHPYTQRLFMASPVPNPDHQEIRRRERRALLDAAGRRRGARSSRMTTPATSTQPETVQHLIPLLDKLTLEQKAALVQGADFWTTVPLPEIGLRAMTLSDGPAGVRGPRWDEREPSLNMPSGSASPPRGMSSWPTATARPRHPKPVARMWTSCSARRSTCTARRSAAATSSASAKTPS